MVWSRDGNRRGKNGAAEPDGIKNGKQYLGERDLKWERYVFFLERVMRKSRR